MAVLPTANFFDMKALVTGGAGFIGSHLVERLLGQGWNVSVLDDLSSGEETNLPSGAEFVRGSAGDVSVLERLLPGSDAVFHLAAVSSVADSLARPLQVHDANLTTTLALLEASAKHGVKRFVFSSSASIYGDTGGEAAREEMKPSPLSHYAVQKLACEHYCAVYRRLRGLGAVCLRYFNVFGPRQRADSPYSGVIAKFVASARVGEPMTVFGDGSQSRDFVSVHDVVEANIAAAGLADAVATDAVFNVGSGRSITVGELAEAIRGHFSSCPPVRYAPARDGEIKYSRADIRRTETVLGYQPRVEFARGLDELLGSQA